MEKKSGLFSFNRVVGRKGSGGGGGGGGSRRWWWSLRSSGFRWKRLRFQLWFVDGFLFKIVSVFEAIFLVATLCFFYLCCGCHI